MCLSTVIIIIIVLSNNHNIQEAKVFVDGTSQPASGATLCYASYYIIAIRVHLEPIVSLVRLSYPPFRRGESYTCTIANVACISLGIYKRSLLNVITSICTMTSSKIKSTACSVY